MNHFRRSIPTFIFGLSIGLLLGVGFFMFKINDIFKNMRDNLKEQVTVVEQPVKNVKEEEEMKRKDKERFKINLKKGVKVNYKEADSLIRKDNELNVATDELVSIKSVKLIRLEDGDDDDSTAARLAGVEKKSSSLYFIEFWKTPLNSKGYRFTKNKLMLYGFVDFSDLLIYELDNAYYLKASEQVYKLRYTSDFKQLEKVVDNDLLAKMI